VQLVKLTEDSTIYNEDCFDVFPHIESGSVDMILTDVPYGITHCKWDVVIPFAPMWKHLKRIIKPNNAIVLFGSEPFSSALRLSNIENYKYDWIWEKTKSTNFLNAKKQPLKKHENISVFYKCQCTYSPQMTKGNPYTRAENGVRKESSVNRELITKGIKNNGVRYPVSIQKFSNGNQGNIHPTQKPVALMEYLIKTYTNEGETVLDFTMGSGTTGVACKNLNRKFIGIEKDPDIFETARNRIENHIVQMELL